MSKFSIFTKPALVLASTCLWATATGLALAAPVLEIKPEAKLPSDMASATPNLDGQAAVDALLSSARSSTLSSTVNGNLFVGAMLPSATARFATVPSVLSAMFEPRPALTAVSVSPITPVVAVAAETPPPVVAAPAAPETDALKTVQAGSSAMGLSLLDRLQQGVQSLAGTSQNKSKAISSLSDSLSGAADAASGLLNRALSLLGTPYRYGGVSAVTGFDCSGFVLDVFAKSMQVVLPRTAAQQAHATQKIDKEELRPGDLVFFNTMKNAFSHVGIYLGNDEFVHAPSSGSHVRVDSLNNKYWRVRFNGARRVPAAQ